MPCFKNEDKAINLAWRLYGYLKNPVIWIVKDQIGVLEFAEGWYVYLSAEATDTMLRVASYEFTILHGYRVTNYPYDSRTEAEKAARSIRDDA